jgi:hypothetical protein
VEARRTTGRRWRPPTAAAAVSICSAVRSRPVHDRLRCRCTGWPTCWYGGSTGNRRPRAVWSSGDPTPLSRRCPPAQCPPVRGRARAGAAAAAPPCTGAAAGPKHRSAARTAQRASAHRAPHPAPRKGRGFQVGQPPTGTAPETIPSPRRPDPVPYSVDHFRCAPARGLRLMRGCSATGHRPPKRQRRSGRSCRPPRNQTVRGCRREEGSIAAAQGGPVMQGAG